MRTIRSGAAVLATTLLSAAAASPAFAQSPYQGSWSGTFVATTTSSCSATGPGGTTVYTQTCTSPQPWTGSVDATGKFVLTRYAGTGACTTNVPQSPPIPTISDADPSPITFGIINSGGTISLAPNVNTHTFNSGNGTVTTTCPAFTMQFAGTTMSSTESCTQTSHVVIPETSTTGDCSGIYVPTYIGTKGSAGVTSPPVFPVNTSSTITTTTATATATIQPRPQDVGTNASIFVFAQAPSNLVLGATALERAPASPPIPAATDDAIVCVLAQVNSSGQLVAVSASNMQAYVSGVLASQSQSLNLLNNVPVANVAGASVFVGYGASASAMLSSGIFQTAVSIPGAVQCSARTDSAPAATSPGSLSGLWWNANESGWGLHLTQRGANKFAAWYTYDAAGKPKWYVATCAGASGTSGTCNGTLYEVTGPNFFGGGFNASLVNAVNAGNLQITFSNANAASMTYTAVAGQTRTVALTRQPLASGTTPPAIDYTDIWWNPSESGWGMAMTQQFGVTFLAWYVYDANGKPTWLVSTCTMSGSSCSGTLYRTTGPAFGPTFDSTQVQPTSVGTAIVSFIDANNAVLSYTVDGVSATKTVTRQLF